MSDSQMQRVPRRIVLLQADENSPVEQVLQEQSPSEVSGKQLHAALRKHAEEHPGKFVAAEWLGTLGWTRFLWCRR